MLYELSSSPFEFMEQMILALLKISFVFYACMLELRRIREQFFSQFQ